MNGHDASASTDKAGRSTCVLAVFALGIGVGDDPAVGGQQQIVIHRQGRQGPAVVEAQEIGGDLFGQGPKLRSAGEMSYASGQG